LTAHVAPIALNFDEGIDRKILRRLRDRFLVVNQQRWQRAHSALTYRQQVVLDILPLVFHANHPALPGYQDADCPYGLSHYHLHPQHWAPPVVWPVLLACATRANAERTWMPCS